MPLLKNKYLQGFLWSRPLTVLILVQRMRLDGRAKLYNLQELEGDMLYVIRDLRMEYEPNSVFVRAVIKGILDRDREYESCEA